MDNHSHFLHQKPQKHDEPAKKSKSRRKTKFQKVENNLYIFRIRMVPKFNQNKMKLLENFQRMLASRYSSQGETQGNILNSSWKKNPSRNWKIAGKKYKRNGESAHFFLILPKSKIQKITALHFPLQFWGGGVGIELAGGWNSKPTILDSQSAWGGLGHPTKMVFHKGEFSLSKAPTEKFEQNRRNWESRRRATPSTWAPAPMTNLSKSFKSDFMSRK